VNFVVEIVKYYLTFLQNMNKLSFAILLLAAIGVAAIGTTMTIVMPFSKALVGYHSTYEELPGGGVSCPPGTHWDNNTNDCVKDPYTSPQFPCHNPPLCNYSSYVHARLSPE
jgi:hypothetical protein